MADYNKANLSILDGRCYLNLNTHISLNSCAINMDQNFGLCWCIGEQAILFPEFFLHSLFKHNNKEFGKQVLITFFC